MRTSRFWWAGLTVGVALWAGCGAPSAPLESAGVTPLSTLDGAGADFRVFSAHATRIEVWLFAAAGDATPVSTHALQRGPGDVWHARVEGVRTGALYGFRAWGPNWPWVPSWTPGSMAGFVSHVDAAGNRFDPNKLLLDPYARAITGDVARVQDPVTGAMRYDPSILGGTDAYAALDSAGAMPKSVLVAPGYAWGSDTRPGTPAHESVVYEVHLRGFTRGDDRLPADLRGTYDGFAARAGYLRDLGITAVELLPVQDFLRFSDPVPGETEGRTNYWGYMTHGFFAPERAYLCANAGGCPQALGEEVNAFRRMVRALHDEGIEVWMDVVYNHTGEGGACAGVPLPYLNFRGLDNQSYYTLGDDRSCYWETTGVGNNMNAASPAVRQLVLDSLRYWIDEMHVDGFRFDLAYELGRVHDDGRGFDPNAQLLVDIAALGRDRGVKMVAEAWDAQGYGVGQFPDGWMEWNGRWRDNVRRFVRGDADMVGGLGASVSASHPGLPPAESVNFVTAHDGFTLNDLVSYDRKLNGVGPCNPLGQDPNSGTDDNASWDHGGDLALRRQQMRNFVVHLATHQGVPMIVAGDEMARTQHGNNNGYMADNPCGWLSWADLTTHAAQHDFTRAMIGVRASHPALGRTLPLTGTDHDADGRADIVWHGVWPDRPDWSASSRTLAFELDGSAAETGGAFDAPDLYVAFNGFWQPLTFHLPNPPPSQCWYRVADTATWAESEGNRWYDGDVPWSVASMPAMGEQYELAARSALVLAARPCAGAAPGFVDFEVTGAAGGPGYAYAVVGADAQLGSWDPAQSLVLQPAGPDRWSGRFPFTERAGTLTEFKFIRLVDGALDAWETGGNRTFTLPGAGQTFSVTGVFRDPAPPPPPPPPSLRLCAEKPGSWTTVYAHTWNAQPAGARADTLWPGDAMTAATGDWYCLEYSGVDAVHVVFDDPGGAQTPDLFRDRSGCYSIPTGAWSDTCVALGLP